MDLTVYTHTLIRSIMAKYYAFKGTLEQVRWIYGQVLIFFLSLNITHFTPIVM